MKRTLVASILGLAISAVTAVTSYGQGQVIFANYIGGSVNAPVTIQGSGLAAGNSYKAELQYSYNGVNFFDVANDVTTFLGNADGDTGNGAGYFVGNAVTITDYVSGPITFIVRAYNGADFASASIRGTSAAFTLPSIATGLAQVGDFGAFITPWTVAPVPEPTVLALAGLGSLLLFRRRNS